MEGATWHRLRKGGEGKRGGGRGEGRGYGHEADGGRGSELTFIGVSVGPRESTQLGAGGGEWGEERGRCGGHPARYSLD